MDRVFPMLTAEKPRKPAKMHRLVARVSDEDRIDSRPASRGTIVLPAGDIKRVGLLTISRDRGHLQSSDGYKKSYFVVDCLVAHDYYNT
jgi:hypothetical protein